MQQVVVRRLLSGADLLGSAGLIVVPLISGAGPNTAFPGAIGVILSAASLYWTSGERYTFFTGVVSFTLFAAFASWSFALWGTYTAVSDSTALGSSLACALLAIVFLLLTAFAFGLKRDHK